MKRILSALLIAVMLIVSAPIASDIGVTNVTISASAATVYYQVSGTDDKGLRLRKGPGTSYDTLIIIHEGGKVKYLNKKSNGFLKVSYAKSDGKTYTGWVSADYVKKVTSSSSSIAKVTGLKASSATSSSITLKWTKVTGASGYIVYLYSKSTGKYTKLGTKSTNSCKISNVKKGTTYYFAVAAYSGSSTGAKSSLLKVTVK